MEQVPNTPIVPAFVNINSFYISAKAFIQKVYEQEKDLKIRKKVVCKILDYIPTGFWNSTLDKEIFTYHFDGLLSSEHFKKLKEMHIHAFAHKNGFYNENGFFVPGSLAEERGNDIADACKWTIPKSIYNVSVAYTIPTDLLNTSIKKIAYNIDVLKYYASSYYCSQKKRLANTQGVHTWANIDNEIAFIAHDIKPPIYEKTFACCKKWYACVKNDNTTIVLSDFTNTGVFARGPVACLSASPNGQFLGIGFLHAYLTAAVLYDVVTASFWPLPESQCCWQLVFTQQGGIIYYSPLSEDVLHIENIQEYCQNPAIEPIVIGSGGKSATKLAVSNSGALLAVAKQDIFQNYIIRIKNIIKKDTNISVCQGHKTAVRHICFDEEKGLLFSAGSVDNNNNPDPNIMIWDISTGTCLHTLETDHTDQISGIDYKNDILCSVDVSGKKCLWQPAVQVSQLLSLTMLELSWLEHLDRLLKMVDKKNRAVNSTAITLKNNNSM